MKKILVIILMILISYNCSLFEGENSSNKLPSGWSEVDGLQGGLVSAFFTDNNRIFAGKQTYGISYSDENTEEWTDINNGIDEIDPEYHTTLDRRTISAFVKMNGDIYIGVETSVGVGSYEGKDYEFVGGLYKYFDSENRWDYIGFKELSILDIEVIEDKFIVGTFDGIYILEKVDGNWIKTNIGFDDIDFSNISIIDSTIIVARVWDIYKSSDCGKNWTDIHTGILNNHSINCMQSVGNTLYVGTDNGVYISGDLGNNWIEVNNGIPFDNTTGYATITQLMVSDSELIGIYLSDTYENGNDIPFRVSSGIIHTNLNYIDWNIVELGDEKLTGEPFSIGIIDNKILVGFIKSGMVGSTNHEVWINNTILND